MPAVVHFFLQKYVKVFYELNLIFLGLRTMNASPKSREEQSPQQPLTRVNYSLFAFFSSVLITIQFATKRLFFVP